MSQKPSNDDGETIIEVVAAATVKDAWIDEAARQIVIVYPWGESRIRPSELSFERAMRDGGVRIICKDGSIRPARRDIRDKEGG
jgi:hypothetical protein